MNKQWNILIQRLVIVMLCEYCAHESECTKITSGVCRDFRYFNSVDVENIKVEDTVYLLKRNGDSTVCPCQFKIESIGESFVKGYILDKNGIFRENRERSMPKSVISKAAYKCLVDVETVAEEINTLIRRKVYVV